MDKVGGSLTFTSPARPLGQRLRPLETPLETLRSAFDSSPQTRRIFSQREKWKFPILDVALCDCEPIKGSLDQGDPKAQERRVSAAATEGTDTRPRQGRVKS